ncbi:MAG: two-component sensor histidine kinase [Sphingomonadales bacterium]|nr:two-component sensor histidine kinase [Sphingomonadales bacterium]MDE2171583.1 two-component sensor histidine kinase [Sphingomonadales bacterium]
MTVNTSPFAALKSGAFRFALMLALVFALGSVGLLWTVERQMEGYGDAATDLMLRAEGRALAGAYAEAGLPGLLTSLRRQSGNGGDQQFHFLLEDARGHRLFGDIDVGQGRLGDAVITVTEPDSGPVTMREVGLEIGSGLRLFVATDFFDFDELQDRLARFTIICGVSISIFALVGGYGAGSIFLRRLDRVSCQVERIVAGDSDERLPAIGLAPEFDMLTRGLNRMLDHKDAAMEAVRQVSTAIAHDLRTPLMRLQQRLVGLAREPEERHDAVGAAIEDVEGILSTFQALLHIGMIEGGVGRRRFRRVSISKHLGRVLETYGPVAEDAGHQLVARITDDLSVEGDAEMLTQLFINLIENAIVHTPAGTRISVDLDLIGDVVRARVSDDGPGVAAADHERIFRRFYRGSASKGLPGTGLGLSLVAAIADAHRVRYRMVKGAGFTLELDFPGFRHDLGDPVG